MPSFRLRVFTGFVAGLVWLFIAAGSMATSAADVAFRGDVDDSIVRAGEHDSVYYGDALAMEEAFAANSGGGSVASDDAATKVICNVVAFVQKLGLPIMTGVILGSS
ncbi:MAG: hypothetical protein ACTJLL_02005, partial [Anaplasma sp.]